MKSLPPLVQTALALLTLTAQIATAYDQCGPLIPVDNVTDTCTAPLAVGTLPSIYGVQCWGNMKGPFIPPNGTDCNDLVPQICAVMTGSDLVYEMWHWVSNPANTCTAGFYMPGPKDNGDGTVFSAPVPTNERCQATVFDGMLNACTGGPNWDNINGQWNYAAVNLREWPGQGVNGEPADGGWQYPSYFVSATQPVTPAKPQ